MYKLFIYTYFFLFYSNNRVNSEYCMMAQECKTSEDKKIRCSSYGKCFYDTYGYFLTNQTGLFQTCVCHEGYHSLDSDDIKCCYKKKSQFYAFILEFLIGFGLGHLYCGNHTLFLLKLFGASILCCNCCLISICFCNTDDTSSEEKPTPIKYQIFNFLLIFSFFAYIIWQCTDGVMYGLNMFKDGNGVDLEPW